MPGRAPRKHQHPRAHLPNKRVPPVGDRNYRVKGRVKGQNGDYRTKRVGFMVTCRLAGVGKSVFEVVVSSWARAWSLDLSRWGVGRSFAATVSTVPGHRRATGCASGCATGGATGCASGCATGCSASGGATGCASGCATGCSASGGATGCASGCATGGATRGSA